MPAWLQSGCMGHAPLCRGWPANLEVKDMQQQCQAEETELQGTVAQTFVVCLLSGWLCSCTPLSRAQLEPPHSLPASHAGMVAAPSKAAMPLNWATACPGLIVLSQLNPRNPCRHGRHHIWLRDL